MNSLKLLKISPGWMVDEATNDFNQEAGSSAAVTDPLRGYAHDETDVAAMRKQRYNKYMIKSTNKIGNQNN